jgi:hypothetical protein
VQGCFLAGSSSGLYRLGRCALNELAKDALFIWATCITLMSRLAIGAFVDRTTSNRKKQWIHLETGSGTTHPILAALGIYCLAATAPSYAERVSEHEAVVSPALVCNEPKPSTSAFSIVETRGYVTLWERELAERVSEFLMIDRNRCYINFEAGNYALERLDRVVDATVTSFDPETAFPTVLGLYFEDVHEEVDLRCSDTPIDRGRTAQNSISDYEYCSVRSIRRYLRRGLTWQFDFIDGNAETITFYTFDGILIGGYVLDHADSLITSDFSYIADR